MFPNGAPEITFDIAIAPPLVDAAARQIVDDLAKVGVPVKLQPIPADQYAARTAAADRELFQASWSAAYPSPDAFLAPLFYSPSISNVSALKDQKVDEAISNAQKEANNETRKREYQSAERNVMDKLPIVPLVQYPVNSVASNGVRGVDPLPTGNFNIANVWLENAPQG